MNNDEFDIQAEAPSDKLEALNSRLEEAVSLEGTIELLEADLAEAKRALNHIKLNLLPDMMDELEMPKLTFRDWSVSIRQVVAGSLPKKDEARAAAIKWLVANEGGGLIRSDLSLSFPRSETENALKVARSLEEDGYAPSVSTNVHAQSLQAFVRERLKNGEEVDTEILGVFVGRQAQFKKVK